MHGLGVGLVGQQVSIKYINSKYRGGRNRQANGTGAREDNENHQ